MTINKINIRGSVMALALGAIVTVIPASADSISFTATATPATVQVAGANFNFSTVTSGTYSPTIGNLLAGTSVSNSYAAISYVGNANASATASQVIDINVRPTINGVQATQSVEFQGSIYESGGQYFLDFANNGTNVCAGNANCFFTGNGSTINNGQQVVTGGALQGDTELTVNGVEYAVQTLSVINPTKPLNFLAGYIGVPQSNAPEPTTWATMGLGAAFLGMFLRRKAKNS